MRRHKILLTITLLMLATFCLVGTVIAAKVLLYKEPGFSGDWDNGTGEPALYAYGECDKSSGKCVYEGASCAYGEYDEDTGKCKVQRYKLIYYSERASWDKAKTGCENMGAHLVTIMSEEENQAVNALSIARTHRAWIGLRWQGYDGWRWVTGEEVTYTKWHRGCPHDSSHSHPHTYAGIDKNNGTWRDYTGGKHSLPGICERDWEFGATGLCPEGYTYQRDGYNAYCYGDPECPDGYHFDQDSGNCIGDPQ